MTFGPTAAVQHLGCIVMVMQLQPLQQLIDNPSVSQHFMGATAFVHAWIAEMTMQP